MFHQTCKTLIYDTFLNIIDSGTIELLVISGLPDRKELLAAWESILNEYSELIKTDKSDSITALFKKITYTNWKLVFIEKGLYVLKHEYFDWIAERIAGLGYDLIQPLEDREAYLKQIYGVEQESKFLVVLLNQYNAEYKLHAPDDQQQKIRTLMDYEKEIAMLSKFMGSRINKKEITVFEWAGIVNLYLELNKKEKAK